MTPEKWFWAEKVHYSQAVRAGSLVFTCGVAPFDDHGRVVGVGDFEAQFHKTVDNLKVLLEAAGSSFDRIIRQNVYLKRTEDLERFKALRTATYRYPYPASVMVVVTAHAHPDMLVEIACEALVI